MSENEWTLEQRLVAQLSHALQQDTGGDEHGASADAAHASGAVGAAGEPWSASAAAAAPPVSASAVSQPQLPGPDLVDPALAGAIAGSAQAPDMQSILSQSSVSRLIEYINQPHADAAHADAAHDPRRSTGSPTGAPLAVNGSAASSELSALASALAGVPAGPSAQDGHASALLAAPADHASAAGLPGLAGLAGLAGLTGLPGSHAAGPASGVGLGGVTGGVAGAKVAETAFASSSSASASPAAYGATPHFELDAEVASIRNVLQSLLDPTVANKVLHEPSAGGLTLSAETESLRASIEASLRKEFDIPAAPAAPPPRAPSPPARRTYRRRKPLDLAPPAPVADAGGESDTLRAIQQALLGAIDPAAAAAERASTVPLAPAVPASPAATRDKDARLKDRKRKSEPPSKDEEIKAKVLKRANLVYGAGASREKETFIADEVARRKQKLQIQSSINALLAQAKEKDDVPAPYTRRLAQHTKEAASNHLSQLFRKSNSVLEPRMPKEKAAAPASPYLLMSFPKRPAYRASAPTRASRPPTAENRQEESAHGATTPLGVTDAAASASASVGAAKVAPSSPPPGGRAAATTSPGLGEGEAEGPGPEQEHAPSPDVSREASREASASTTADTSADTSAGISADASTATQTKARASAPLEAAGASSPGASIVNTRTRPRHRYALVGRLNFGAPPNLAAIMERHA